MAMINCPECGAKVSSYATRCPKCGITGYQANSSEFKLNKTLDRISNGKNPETARQADLLRQLFDSLK